MANLASTGGGARFVLESVLEPPPCASISRAVLDWRIGLLRSTPSRICPGASLPPLCIIGCRRLQGAAWSFRNSRGFGICETEIPRVSEARPTAWSIPGCCAAYGPRGASHDKCEHVDFAAKGPAWVMCMERLSCESPVKPHLNISKPVGQDTAIPEQPVFSGRRP